MDKWLIILGMVGALYIVGCNEKASTASDREDDIFKPQGGPADLVYNPVRPDGSIDSSYLPVITWIESVFEFGSVNDGDIIQHDFSFTNTGTAPLIILTATTTCGCTVPEWPKKPIPPDSTASIQVKFNTLDKTGAQTKEVTIFANTFPNQHKLTMKGVVESIN